VVGGGHTGRFILVPLLMSFATAGDNNSSNSEAAYVSPAEFVRLSGLSSATVRRYLEDGRLPKVQPGGPRCRVLIPRNALDAFRPQTARPGAPETRNFTADESAPSLKNPPPHHGPAPRWMGRR